MNCLGPFWNYRGTLYNGSWRLSSTAASDSCSQCWLMCRQLGSQHASTPSSCASGTVMPSARPPVAMGPAHRSGCSTDRSRAFHYIHRARVMMDAGASALGHSSSDRPWQPLSRIARRQTGQRTDIRQRHVPALTSLGKDEKGRGVSKTGEPAGPRTQDPRLKRAMLYQLSYRLTEWKM